MTDLLKLDGRIVVVSGAGGGGIGTTVTRMTAEAGATVVAVSRSEENLDEHVAPLAARGLAVIPVAADASTDDGIGTVLDAVRGTDGDLYGLVNVAGGAEPATWMPSTRVTREDWRALLAANLETAFFMSQAVAAEIRGNQRPGSIVSISSISGMNTAPFHIAYGTAKAAVVAMTRTMAVELAQDNIRVNAVAPGVTATAASLTYTGEDPERDRQAIAMGRTNALRIEAAREQGLAEAQTQVDVATFIQWTDAYATNDILFLLSDLSSYITGQTLLVDGGLNLKWTHLGADNTSLFLKDETFREEISRP